jgi:hypothetical protein
MVSLQVTFAEAARTRAPGRRLAPQGGRASCGTGTALPEDNDQIIAATYRRYLPTKVKLAADLECEREEVERVLRMTALSADGAGGIWRAGNRRSGIFLGICECGGGIIATDGLFVPSGRSSSTLRK